MYIFFFSFFASFFVPFYQKREKYRKKTKKKRNEPKKNLLLDIILIAGRKQPLACDATATAWQPFSYSIIAGETTTLSFILLRCLLHSQLVYTIGEPCAYTLSSRCALSFLLLSHFDFYFVIVFENTWNYIIQYHNIESLAYIHNERCWE